MLSDSPREMCVFLHAIQVGPYLSLPSFCAFDFVRQTMNSCSLRVPHGYSAAVLDTYHL